MSDASRSPGVGARAFVAGATGYTGREVVRALVARGVMTVAHVRPDAPRLEEWRDRFAADGALVDETPWEEAAMTTTFTRLRPTHVFALLGTTRARSRAEARSAADGYERIDYGLTALLLRAALAAGSQPRFVYLSAAGVRERSGNPYIAVRWRMERELAGSGLLYVIARPSFITGPDREESRPAERIAATVADALGAFAGALGATGFRDRYRSTSAATLARALVRLALDPATADGVVESEALRD